MFNQLKFTCRDVYRSLRKNYKSATLNFIFVFLFINLFQKAFGPENAITAIVLVIIMPSSMLRDFTLAPVKHFIGQFFILEGMVVSAFLVTTINIYAAISINFVTLLILIYALTFEYASDLYMPYILSYLFLIFISPVDVQHLPKRVLAMLVGTVCVMLYQFVRGHNRAGETVRTALTAMLDEAHQCIQCLLTGNGIPDSQEIIRNNLYKLTHLIDDQRKGNLSLSDASFAMLDCGRELEKLIHILYNIEGAISPDYAAVLRSTDERLDLFRTFVMRQSGSLAPVESLDLSCDRQDFGEKMHNSLVSIQACLINMNTVKKRLTYHQTALSFSVRIKTALNASPVRVAYSLRVAILLTLLTLFVQLLQLPHGKWLLFTVASVSLPYADDVGPKAKKRLFATLLGGCMSVIAFASIPSPLGRSLLMLLAGYLSAYFSDYRFTFACSTIGAMGGAVAVGIFGWSGVGGIFVIRLGYICLGIVVAYILNCFVFPFKHSAANKHLWEKHLGTIRLLAKIYPTRANDPQLYYGLIVYELLQAEKLASAMSADDREKMKSFLVSYCDTLYATSPNNSLSGAMQG